MVQVQERVEEEKVEEVKEEVKEPDYKEEDAWKEKIPDENPTSIMAKLFAQDQVSDEDLKQLENLDFGDIFGDMTADVEEAMGQVKS